jgi:uncharacterized phage protein (TIGR02218 family)
MAFDTIERSEQSAAPVELYEFYLGDSTWFYTSAEQDVVVGGNTYLSDPISRTQVALSVEEARNAIQLTVRRNNPVADLFRVYPPQESVSLIMKRYHRGDAEVGTLWVGRVLSVAWNNTATAIMNCEPASISTNRNGLGRYYQVPCPFALYGSDCTVNRATHAYAATVASFTGATVTLGAIDGAPYPGGYVERANGDSPPLYERRLITSVAGAVLTLNRPFSELAISDALTLYPGCDHTITTCDTTFNNKLNYGGFPHMPKKNPFDGPPVY